MLNNINDILKKVEDGESYLTNFLDFQEQKEIMALSKLVKFKLFGGFQDAERVRAFIYPSYYDLNEIDFEIAFLEFIVSENFQLNHRQVLGAIMNLGIKRSMCGDILINKNKCYLILSKSIVDYVKTNFSLYKMPNLKIEYVSSIPTILSAYDYKEIIVPSLRLDALLAKSLNKSREESSQIIRQGSVFVNHLEKTDVDYNLKPLDIISVRHFGRIEINEIIKTTKKNRLLLRIGIKH